MQFLPRAALRAACAGAVLASTPAVALSAEDHPAPGFASTEQVDPGGVVRELSDGRLLAFDGQFVRLFAADGTPLQTLADLGANFFTGALAVDPGEQFAVVGETSLGDLFRVELDGSGHSLLTNLFFNYDATFGPDGDLFVSAAVGGFGTGADVVRVDPDTGATQFVAHVAGSSGPLALDAAGNLFYATVSASFPAPLGSTDVLLWTAAQVDSGLLLDESDALVFGAGFDGATALVCDRTTGDLFLAEASFGSGVNRIVRVVGSAGVSPVLVEGEPFQWMTVAQYFDGTGPAIFAPFQPASGRGLVFEHTDFATFDRRLDLEPLRPSLQLTGPGTVGAGSFALEFSGCAPGGSCLIFFGPSALVGPEVALPLALPLFVALDLGTAIAAPFLLPVDGNGEAQLAAYNPGALLGLVSFQGLVLDTFGAAVGTSELASL
jgi:hypothetical protein